ncbi:hypothetical protein EDD21DRAFT_386059 [Dissophora ornata]|nr:hypothetical protein EDD21DRAFT_386059 [Dissophora ornata]
MEVSLVLMERRVTVVVVVVAVGARPRPRTAQTEDMSPGEVVATAMVPDAAPLQDLGEAGREEPAVVLVAQSAEAVAVEAPHRPRVGEAVAHTTPINDEQMTIMDRE